MWVRVTHAATGKPLYLNLQRACALFPMDSDTTEIAYGPNNLMYYVKETPDQIWEAVRMNAHKVFDPLTYVPYIQIAPVTTVKKTSARTRK